MFMPNRRFLDRFPESGRFEVEGRVTVDADTLDAQLRALGVPDVDFVKIDAQGGALAVLRGGRDTVRRSVFGVEVEVEFTPMYERQPLFSDVDRFMSDSGFSLFDMRPYYWKRSLGKAYGGPKGQMIMADALYLKNSDDFVRNLEADTAVSRSKLLRAISVCLLYGYFDYALDLVDATGDKIKSDDSTILRACIQRLGHNSQLTSVSGRFRRAVRALLESTHHGWALARGVLGNLD